MGSARPAARVPCSRSPPVCLHHSISPLHVCKALQSAFCLPAQYSLSFCHSSLIHWRLVCIHQWPYRYGSPMELACMQEDGTGSVALGRCAHTCTYPSSCISARSCVLPAHLSAILGHG